MASWSAIASNATDSSSDCDRISCTSAIDVTRRTDSCSASLASVSFIRRPCSRSSAATVCRLFFTRWWISRIVASLLSSWASRRRSSVTSRTRTSAPCSAPDSSGMARSTTTTPSTSSSSSCGSRCRVAASTPRRSGELRADPQPGVDVAQPLPGQVAGVPEPPVGGDGVGARVGDEAGLVEAEHPVADPGGLEGRDVALGGNGKRALADHQRQVVGAAEVGHLERARPPGRHQVRVADEHGDRPSRSPARGGTGMASTRTGTPSSYSGSPSRTMRRSRQAVVRLSRRSVVPNRSAGCTVGPVAGRTWATTRNSGSVGSGGVRVGTQSSRSANDRSASSPHSADEGLQPPPVRRAETGRVRRADPPAPSCCRACQTPRRAAASSPTLGRRGD